MMPKADLRFRIATAITATCIVIVTVIGMILYAASEELEESLVEQLVSEELNFLIQHYQSNPAHIPETSPSISYYVITGPQQEMVLPSFARGLQPGLYDVDIGNGLGERHVAIRDVDAVRYVVVYDLGPYEDREEEFKLLVAVSLLMTILVTPFIGILLSNFLVRQLTQLTRQVAGLSPGDAPVQLYHDNLGREVGILARTLDLYQQRIRDMLQREQDFTANVSHELRTPLTEIRTSCELLVRETEWSQKSVARVRYIAKAEQDMRSHMEALLYLARDQTEASTEIVALHECVQDIVASLRQEIAAKQLKIEVDIAPEVSVRINRKALHLIVLNILKNAIRFTDAGSVSLSYRENILSVTDTGIGIAEEDVARIFERHYRGSDRREGFGIGLDIVRKICDREGWSIELRSSRSMGSTFRINLGTDG